MSTVAAAEPPRWVGPRLKFLPIVLVLIVGMVVLQLAFFAVHEISQKTTPGAHWPMWLSITLAETFELGLALIGIAIAKRLLRDADFGLRWPPGRTYVGWAVFWGVAFALIMLVADDWPALIHLRPPEVPEAATPVNIAGWLGFELLWVGICEETLFRGLLLGVLMALSPSKIRIGGTQFSTAGITIALLFALAHAGNFASRPGTKPSPSRFTPSRSGSFTPGCASVRGASYRPSSPTRSATSARPDWSSCSMASCS